tara:strand:+ start:2763 stop:3239 length:477 start_codon:yes stop_codon:yes gene_type:complete
MHAVFIPYGKLTELQFFYRDAESQKYLWRMWQGDKENPTKLQHIYLGGGLRTLPFGIMEYCFPQEHVDIVLNTLKFDFEGKAYTASKHGKIPYSKIIGRARMLFLRKLAGCEPIPEFKRGRVMPWTMQNIKIIPLGVRYDCDMTETSGDFAGWTHEAI